MVGLATWKKSWAILDTRERRNAAVVLAVVLVGAASAVAMIGSIMPFLAVLSNPSKIEESTALAWAYQAGGFEDHYSFLFALGLASIAVIVISNLLQVLRVYIVTRFALMRMHSIGCRLLANYLRQPYTFFLQNNTGDMGTQILAESQQVVNKFYRPAAEFIAAIITVGVIVGFLIWVNPTVTLAAFLVIGGAYGMTLVLTRKRISRLGLIRAQSNAERFRITGEALGGVKEIKILGREAAYVRRFSHPSRRVAKAITTSEVLSLSPQYMMQALAFGGMIALCLVLLEPEGLTAQAPLSDILPILGLFAFAGQRLIPELSRAYANVTKLTFAAAAVDTVYRDLVEQKSDVDLPRQLPAPMGLSKTFDLDGIEYRYAGSDRANLADVSLSIKAGERIGIVGSTGSGKSTLANVILGLLTPSSGRVVVDGVTLSQENLRAWQQTIGYVPQEIFLADATLAENIALGVNKRDIDMEKVRTAAKIAKIDDFVTQELAEGYDCVVGERGVRLSGGQRQRIGIARAMYHDADLIVLDEATSALDNVTEKDVMEAIEGLPGAKTLIMIAHRLTTLRSCDRIIVLDKGRVALIGSWDEVIAENGLMDLQSAS